MNTINVSVRRKSAAKNFSVEIDAEAFERMAALFGFFNPDFLKSIRIAEKEYRAGKVRKIRSLSELK